MLRIAVQSKGRLYEDTMSLLAEADIKISASKRTLLVQSTNFPVEVLYLRDDDIPQSVATGVADLGVVGENEYIERGGGSDIVSRLGFSKCRLSLAIPKDIDYQGLEWFNNKKIATSYPVILKDFLDKNNINAEIHVITGSVEISPGIGLADAIFDIVSSGSTLVSNNLREVEVVMESEALLIGNKSMDEQRPERDAVPFLGSKECRRQEVCQNECSQKSAGRNHQCSSRLEKPYHNSSGRRCVVLGSYCVKPKAILGNHR